jgi:hypothetical protein
MRTLLCLALIGLFFSLSAQETINYPYNPDGDVDGTIASPDLLDILGVYGNAFTPTEIQIDGVGLLEVIQDLQNQIASIQLIDMNYVESTLAAHQQEIEVLQAENETLQTNNAYISQQVLDLQLDVSSLFYVTDQQVDLSVFLGWIMGFEPTAPGTTNQCSNQLSYTHHNPRRGCKYKLKFCSCKCL